MAKVMRKNDTVKKTAYKKVFRREKYCAEQAVTGLVGKLRHHLATKSKWFSQENSGIQKKNNREFS